MSSPYKIRKGTIVQYSLSTSTSYHSLARPVTAQFGTTCCPQWLVQHCGPGFRPVTAQQPVVPSGWSSAVAQASGRSPRRSEQPVVPSGWSSAVAQASGRSPCRQEQPVVPSGWSSAVAQASGQSRRRSEQPGQVNNRPDQDFITIMK